MRHYSAFAIAKQAMKYHQGWERAWASPEPRSHYEVIVIGAGGHGLATAYYLAKNHGIRNVAVLEKGWLGGGNTGRNTTIIRSNYLQPASAGVYELSRSLYEDLSQQLNFNIMFSPRGVMMLCQTEHELRAMKRTAHANRLAKDRHRAGRARAGQGDLPDHQDRGAALPGAGWALAAPRRDGPARCGGLGLCPRGLGPGRGRDPAVRGHRRSTGPGGPQGEGCADHQGPDHLRQALHRRGRAFSGVLADMAGFRLPVESWRCRRWSPSRSSPAWTSS